MGVCVIAVIVLVVLLVVPPATTRKHIQIAIHVIHSDILALGKGAWGHRPL